MNIKDAKKALANDPVFKDPTKNISGLAQALNAPAVKAALGDLNPLELQTVEGASKDATRGLVAAAYSAALTKFAEKKDATQDDLARLRAFHAAFVIVTNGLEEQVAAQLGQKAATSSQPGAAVSVSDLETRLYINRKEIKKKSETGTERFYAGDSALSVKSAVTERLTEAFPGLTITSAGKPAGPGEVYNIAYELVSQAAARKAGITLKEIVDLSEAIRGLVKRSGFTDTNSRVTSYIKNTSPPSEPPTPPDLWLYPYVAEDPKFPAKLKADPAVQAALAEINKKLHPEQALMEKMSLEQKPDTGTPPMS